MAPETGPVKSNKWGPIDLGIHCGNSLWELKKGAIHCKWFLNYPPRLGMFQVSRISQVFSLFSYSFLFSFLLFLFLNRRALGISYINIIYSYSLFLHEKPFSYITINYKSKYNIIVKSNGKKKYYIKPYAVLSGGRV